MPDLEAGSAVPGPFLSYLAPEERQDLLAAGAQRSFLRGDALFHQGDPSRHVVIIHDGWVKVTAVSRNGGEILLAIRGPGDILGELSSVDKSLRGASVRTFTEVQATVITGDRFVASLMASPGLLFALLRHVVASLRESDTRRAEHSTTSGFDRTVHMLVELSDRYGEVDTQGRLIGLPLTQHELAAAVGMSRQVVAQVLGRLRERGIVRTGRKRIIIVYPALLRKLARSAKLLTLPLFVHASCFLGGSGIVVSAKFDIGGCQMPSTRDPKPQRLVGRSLRPAPTDSLAAAVSRRVAEVKEELRYADGKAFRWLGGVGAMMLAGLPMPGDWHDGESDVVRWLWWGGMVLATVSVVALVMAVFPRCSGDPDPQAMTYFRHYSVAEDPETMLNRLSRGERNLRASASQVFWLSRIVSAKYRLTMFAMGVSMLAGGCLFCSMILEMIPPVEM